MTTRLMRGAWPAGLFVILFLLFGRGSELSSTHSLQHLLERPLELVSAVVVLFGVAFGFGWTCRRYPRWRVSPLVGEMFAGFLLGPSLLGYIFPELVAFAPMFARFAHDIGWVGVLLMVQEGGFGVDPTQVRRSGWGVVVLGTVCVLLPFSAAIFLGSTASVIHSNLLGATPWGLLFFAIVVSNSGLVEALRVLKEFRPLQSDLRRTLLPAYALNEMLGFIPLAILLALVSQEGAESGSVMMPMLKLSVAVILGVLSVFIAPRIRDWVNRHQDDPFVLQWFRPLVGAVYGIICEGLGLTPLIGFFVAGTVTGTTFERDNARSSESLGSPYTHAHTFLVPIYFASIGLGINSWESLDIGLLVIVATMAVGLRFAGALLGSRLRPNRFGIAEQRLFGWLFTPAGVTGLVIAQIALSKGFISETLYVALALTMPISVGILPWMLGRAMQELEDAQPIAGRDLARYIPRSGIVTRSTPRKLTPDESDQDYFRRLIPMLGAEFARRHSPSSHQEPLNFVAITEQILGPEGQSAAIVPVGGGFVVAHAGVVGLQEPVALFALMKEPLPITTSDGKPARIVMFSLALHGRDGPERFGQQFWIYRQLTEALLNHPDRIDELLSESDPEIFFVATQRIFRRAEIKK